ncbi:MAG: hypothetical protein KDK36_08320 [Leptospiraceae bacterium]|nr:hypothetical protein [Leptospiraceae bacterium]
MKLNCIECSSNIPSENMNLKTMVAKCFICHEVFSFSEKLKPNKSGNTLEASKLPSEYKWKRSPDEIEITEKSFSYIYFYLLGIAIFWIFLTGSVLFDGSNGFFPKLLLISPSLFFLYLFLIGVLNSTRVVVNREKLIVERGPIPVWRGDIEIKVKDLEQLYCQSKKEKTKNSSYLVYQLNAVLKNNTHVEVLGGFDKLLHVRFIENEFEHLLGIEDREVEGEAMRA